MTNITDNKDKKQFKKNHQKHIAVVVEDLDTIVKSYDKALEYIYDCLTPYIRVCDEQIIIKISGKEALFTEWDEMIEWVMLNNRANFKECSNYNQAKTWIDRELDKTSYIRSKKLSTNIINKPPIGWNIVYEKND